MTMSQDRSIIEEIKSSIDIVHLIGKDISLKRIGNVWKGASNPKSQSGRSFNVDSRLQLWHDWADGTGGDVYDWIARKHNLDTTSDFPEILSIAADIAGVKLPDKKPVYDSSYRDIYTVIGAAVEYYHQCLTDELREHIFQTWGITNDSIDALKIGFAPAGNTLLKEFRELFDTSIVKQTGLAINTPEGVKELYQGRIIFPYWKNGRAVYTIGRKTKYTPDDEYEGSKYKKQLVHNEKNKHVAYCVQNKYFYGEDSIRKSDCCLISEGVTDCIMAIQNGIPSISPVTANISDLQKSRIMDLVKGKDVYVCNDTEDNETGKKGAIATADYLISQGKRIKIITLPEAKHG